MSLTAFLLTPTKQMTLAPPHPQKTNKKAKTYIVSCLTSLSSYKGEKERKGKDETEKSREKNNTHRENPEEEIQVCEYSSLFFFLVGRKGWMDGWMDATTDVIRNRTDAEN